VVAQRGFGKECLDYFRDMRNNTSAGRSALQRQECVVIEDVETDPGFAPHRAIAAAVGFRACNPRRSVIAAVSRWASSRLIFAASSANRT